MELVEFQPVAEALKRHGGTLLAVSVDSPETNRKVVERLKLPFPIVSDNEAKAITQFGVLHHRGGRQGQDIAIPSQVLIGTDGRVLWKHVSARIQDRLDPADVIAAVEDALGT